MNDFSFIKKPFVTVEGSKITFQIQDGPIKEFGVNGCQVDEMIRSARDIVAVFNTKFPCSENDHAIVNLDGAIDWLDKRKSNRERRGVEGYNKT